MTYTLCKEHCELYIEIHSSIAVNCCQVKLAQKDIILLSNVSIIVCETGKRTGVENSKFINFNLSVGTYSIKRQDWEPPQIKDLKLVIPKDYTFMASNAIFITLRISDNYLEKTTLIRSTLPMAHKKHRLIHHLLQNHYHCTVNKSTKLKTSWMVNHQVCCPAYTFLIIRQLFLQCI